MGRAVLILLLSWAYAGCAPRGPGLIRILPTDEQEASTLRATLGSVEGVRFVTAGETDPALVLRLGEADLAVLYGRAASSLLGENEHSVRMRRAPGWDRTYFLWSGSRARWVNDPAFRRWLAGTVRRESLLQFLFDGRGVAAHSLSAPASPILPPPAGTPFVRDAPPRLSLRFDGNDPRAQSIAARIKAELETHGLVLTLLERDARELGEDLRSRELELALWVHRATDGDARESLGRTLRRLGQDGDAPFGTERSLLLQGRLVPIVRLDAWLATRRALKGVRPGNYGELRLDRARWRQ